MDEKTYPFPTSTAASLKSGDVESTFTLHFTVDVITIQAGIKIKPCS